jgi:carbonic anhydrase
MYTALRHRVSAGQPSIRYRAPTTPLRGALIEPVLGGLPLEAADQLLGEFNHFLAGLYVDVPSLAAQICRDTSWGDGAGVLAADYLLPSGRLLLARRRFKPVGMAGARPVAGLDGCAELKRLYVRPGYRGEGIAGELLTVAVNEARRLGYRRLLLESSERMSDAMRIYRHAGFVEIPSYRERPADVDRHYLSMSLDLRNYLGDIK